MKAPVLRNAIEMSELNGGFDALSHARRYHLGIGDHAKVCVDLGEEAGVTGERFWVTIVRAEAGCYLGVVDNELDHSGSHGLFFGDLIPFDYRHIYDVVLQSEFAGLKREVREEMAKPGFKNVTLKPSEENQF